MKYSIIHRQLLAFPLYHYCKINDEFVENDSDREGKDRSAYVMNKTTMFIAYIRVILCYCNNEKARQGKGRRDHSHKEIVTIDPDLPGRMLLHLITL